jgi:hypothetical protein
MYDSVTASDIPTNVSMVAGYISGRYKWKQGDWDRFPTTGRVQIATTANIDQGDVLDVERGDATPDQAPGWIVARRAAGLWRPSIYCPASSVHAVQSACATLGDVWDLWVAHYTGRVPANSEFDAYGANCVAIQYADPVTSGGHYDLSAVRDHGWPHRVVPTPPQPQPEEEEMMIVFADATGQDSSQVLALDGKLYVIDEQATAQGIANAGYKTVAIGHTDYEQMKATAQA